MHDCITWFIIYSRIEEIERLWTAQKKKKKQNKNIDNIVNIVQEKKQGNHTVAPINHPLRANRNMKTSLTSAEANNKKQS